MRIKLLKKTDYHLMDGFAVAENRLVKAKKIEAVLSDYLKKTVKGFKILDFGCGSGHIAGYFAEKGNDVFAVDINDQRAVKSYKFKKIDSEMLPFKDEIFDIIISTNVIEHAQNQDLYLKEARRVLKKDGILFVSSPNWLFPIDPHYGIPLLHYLPKKVYFFLLKKMHKSREDMNLLSYFRLKRLMSKYFNPIEMTHLINKYPKKYFVDIKICYKLCRLPLWLLRGLNFISMNNIFILKKR